MSRILEMIGSTLAALRGHKDKTAGIDKPAVLKTIDANTTLVKAFQSLYRENPAVFKEIYRRMTAKDANLIAHQLNGVYTKLVARLDHGPRELERRQFFASFDAASNLFLRDLELLAQQFDDIFAGQGSTVDATQMKIAHAVVLGYLEQMRLTMEWAVYFTGLAGASDPHWAPKYLLHQLADIEPAVAMLNGLAKRGHYTVIDEINQLKKAGADVFLTADERTVDQYASDADYQQVAPMLQGFMRSPLVVVWDKLAAIQRYFYDRNRTIRDWLAAQIAAIQMQMSGLDPNSEEYKKKEAIIAKYMDMITEYNRKIDAYEKK